MYEWQKWTNDHPVGFWVFLVFLVASFGVMVPNGLAFVFAGFGSGLVWHLRARHTVPKVEAARARNRIAEARRQRAIASDAAIEASLSLPVVPHILLPRGRKIQVTNEEEHLPCMDAFLRGAGMQHVAATLHRLAQPSRRATRERVEVRVDGVAVGELTPYMSEQFLPVIEACSQRGLLVVCRATVRGNELKADVVLDAMRAVDLSDEWIAEHIERR